MVTAPLLEIKNLSIAYDNKEVLRNLELSVAPGEILGIVGSSGGGKSTLLKAVTGILPHNARVSSGQILWQGQELVRSGKINSAPLLGRKISMIFQDPTASLYPAQTIGSQICTLLHSKGQANTAAILQKAGQVLEELGLADPQSILASYPFQLSGGMNQRVCLAMALLLQAPLLLADEPTSGLDVLTQQKILRQLSALKEYAQTSLLIVSHNIGILAKIADKIAVLDQGRIIELGPTAKIINQPQQSYTQNLIRAIPRLREEFIL